MLASLEDGERAVLGAVRADALEHRRAVVQRVRGDADSRLLEGDEGSLEVRPRARPDGAAVAAACTRARGGTGRLGRCGGWADGGRAAGKGAGHVAPPSAASGTVGMRCATAGSCGP